jgi:hypothetical protein
VRHQRPAWTMREGQGVCAEAGRRFARPLCA